MPTQQNDRPQGGQPGQQKPGSGQQDQSRKMPNERRDDQSQRGGGQNR